MSALATTVVGLVVWLAPAGRAAPPAFAEPREHAEWTPASNPDEARADVLRRARVWMPSDPAAVDLAANPPDPGGALSAPLVVCRYLSSPAHGTTTKFDCVLPDGEVIKVKYGHTGEIHAEIAATRLLAALGFGADRMYLIPRLRCYGCLRNPFYAVWALDYLGARDTVVKAISADRYSDFDWVAVERRFEGTEVRTANAEGWSWFELDRIDPSAGGGSRAERDALRLTAMLLAHWDNKAANQRLVVRPEPFAYIHDLGATFGPNKLDLANWRTAPIWSDRASCTISMKTFPYGGGTFPDVRISEAGRQLLLRQLDAIDERHLTALFSAARFSAFHDDEGEAADVSAWARTFLQKVEQIRAAGPCE